MMFEQISKYHYNLSTTKPITMLLLRMKSNNWVTHLKKLKTLCLISYAANSAVW